MSINCLFFIWCKHRKLTDIALVGHGEVWISLILRRTLILDIPVAELYTRYMINMEIPDPFQTFVAKKYANAKGYVHDFFTGEWSYRCLSCKEDLIGPSRKILTKIRLFHTRNECLGGY